MLRHVWDLPGPGIGPSYWQASSLPLSAREAAVSESFSFSFSLKSKGAEAIFATPLPVNSGPAPAVNTSAALKSSISAHTEWAEDFKPSRHKYVSFHCKGL